MRLILPILAIAGTVLATLTAVVFCLSMSANASPDQLRSIKFWTLAVTLLGLAGVVAGIVLMRQGQANLAALAAFAPTGILIILTSISLLK